MMNNYLEELSVKWQSMTLVEQLANVGSEYYRTRSWLKKDKKNLSEKAWVRLHELLYLTIGDKRWRGNERKELTRLREVINKNFEDDFDDKNLEKYFYYFAVAARK